MADFLRDFAVTLRALGERAKQLRLLRDVTQEELAERAGVGVKAVRRFESAGQGTLDTALRVATVLGVEQTFERLFELPALGSLDELDEQEAVSRRQRARKRR